MEIEMSSFWSSWDVSNAVFYLGVSENGMYHPNGSNNGNFLTEQHDEPVDGMGFSIFILLKSS